MIKWITGSFSIFIFLLGTFSTSGNNRHTIDSLVVIGDLRGAAIECERIIYLTNSQKERVEALLLKTEVLKLNSDFHEALATINRVPLFGLTDSVRFEVLYQRILCCYLTERFAEAEAYAIQVTQSPMYRQNNNFTRISILRILTLNEMQKWGRASEILGLLLDSIPEEDLTKAEYEKTLSNYTKKNTPRLRSEKAIFWISFLPGAGIAYAGKPLEGALNLLINSAIVAFGVHQFYYGYYLTGYLGGATLLEKFYSGGRKRGEYLLKKRNHYVSQEFNRKVRNELMIITSQ